MRVAGHGLGLIGLLISYFTIYKQAPQCTEATHLRCDLPTHIFLIFAGIYASGLIGLPWDVLVLWATNSLTDNSPILKDSSFQVVIFGFLAINIWLILMADEIIEAIILYQLNDPILFPVQSGHTWYESLTFIVRKFVIYSFAADFILIPQFVQLVSTASYSFFVYQNQLGV